MTRSPLRLVLDTNIVLDCWVFKDPSAAQLARALEAGRAVPFVHRYALDELERVLAYPQCRLDPRARETVSERYRARAKLASLPDGFAPDNLLLPTGFPACRDPDDDPFVALAYHTQAVLVSKDRAVLKLRRKARTFGVAICTIGELTLI
jgi:putative PIN family toxin of toxin-antitoxin system